MKKNFTHFEYEHSKSTQPLSCICYNCNQPFSVLKKYITYELKQKRNRHKFCSKNCCDDYQSIKIIKYCTNCDATFKMNSFQINKSKSGNHFCSKSCAATYNNVHKKYGTRKSKLEKWLEIRLTELYPNLEIHFNNKNTISSELDIYIPQFKLAFELNGIYHYKPIHGENKLNKIQNNDKRKIQACLERKIELYAIDTTQQKYFKEKTSQKYLDIIERLIHMVRKERFELPQPNGEGFTDP